MESFKTKQDFDDATKIIEDSIYFMKNGKTHHFRSIATQLYILLIDRGNNKGPLVKEIIPDFKLHPVLFSSSKKGEKSSLDKFRKLLGENSILYPTKIEFVKGRPISQYTFDERKESMNLKEWLEQPLLSFNITIKELLKKIRNKVASHSDELYDDTLSQTRFFKIGDIEIDALSILSIGDYVLKRIKFELST